MKEKIRNELRAVLDGLPEMKFSTREEIRNSRVLTKQAFEGETPISRSKVRVTDKHIPGHEKGQNIRVRIYEPVMPVKTISPGLYWIHGGGYLSGTPEMNDELCERFVLEAGCVVVSVAYRLAPEHPYPAGVEDCYAGLKWVAGHAAELGIDAERIGVAGHSAGGGLTAAVSLMARDRGGPEIAFQMPLCPMLDYRNTTVSSREITDTRVWNYYSNEAAWKAYLGDQTEDVPAYASPVQAEDLSGLPPTYTMVGSADPFRDETIEYISRLSQAGVQAEFHLYPGCFHGFEGIAPQAEVSQRAIRGYVNALKRSL